MTDRQHVVVIYTDAGGGHKATADALQQILGAEDRCRVTLVNAYQRVLPAQDLFARWTSRNVEETYNELILRDGRTGLACMFFYVLAVLNVRVMWKQGRRAFKALWEELQPDLVISVLPVINQLLIESLDDYADRPPPFAVVITDWCEMSRAVWFPRNGRYNAVCGTEESRRQMVRMGHPPDRTFFTNGLLLRPAFLAPGVPDVARARAELGLDPDRPVACMLYGGNGSRRMLELAESLAGDPPDVQMIFLCGHDAALAENLRSRSWPFPAVVEGYTPHVHKLLALSDIFIGKPGPASVSEAYALGLDMLLDRVPMLPQERPILNWVRRTGAGRVFKTPDEFRRALTETLRGLRQAPTPGGGCKIERPVRNTAARDIPGILERILGRAVI